MSSNILTRATYLLGFYVRETGQALDRVGCKMQGQYAFREKLSRHRTVMNLFDQKPDIGEQVFIAPSASVIGTVSLGEKSSVWYGAALRGDVNGISIGTKTNIQDRTVIHVASETEETNSWRSDKRNTIVGDSVTVGHGAYLHACEVKDESLVGIGATMLDGSILNSHSQVAAGAVVTPGVEIPAGELWGGVPARFIRKLTTAEIDNILKSADRYVGLAAIHEKETSKPWPIVEKEKLIRKHAHIIDFKLESELPGTSNHRD